MAFLNHLNIVLPTSQFYDPAIFHHSGRCIFLIWKFKKSYKVISLNFITHKFWSVVQNIEIYLFTRLTELAGNHQ